MTTTGIAIIIVGALLIACLGGPVNVTRDRGMTVARFNAPSVIGVVMCWVGAVMLFAGVVSVFRGM